MEFVLLDVVALDRKGQLVDDLKRTDFDVRENKKKVDVTFFDILDFRQSESDDLTDIPEEFRHLVPPKQKQQVILAVDLESVKPLQAQKVFFQMRQFLESFEPTIEYRINLYSLERGSITKGFVEGVEPALTALSELQQRYEDGERRKRRPTGNSDLLLADNPTLSRRNANEGFLSAEATHLRDLEEAFRSCSRLHLDIAGRNRCINESLGAFLEEHRFRTERIIGELEILTYKFQDTQGLKMMLLVSPGFALQSLTSARDLASAYKRGDDLASSGFLDTSGLTFSGQDFQRVIHACIKNRVIFHTFDIFNVDGEMQRATSPAFGGATPRSVTQAYRHYGFEVASGLQELAEESGGNYNRVAQMGKSMTDTLERNRFFYVLGYPSPKDGKPGKFRKIKIKSKRKGVKLRYRAGYFGS